MYSLYKTDKNMKLVSREEEEIKEAEKLKIIATIRVLALQGLPGLPEKMSDDYYKILTKEGDLDSEDLLRMLAERVFSIIKNYPELMRELKEKYFKTI